MNSSEKVPGSRGGRCPRDTDGTSWVRCDACGALVYHRRMRRSLDVCPDCGHHRRIDAETRIAQLTDEGSFEPLPDPVRAVDVLGFADSMSYPDRLARAHRTTGLDDAVRCGRARIGGHDVVLAVMDFRFLGGSLGSAVGEMLCRAAESALELHLPMIVVTASGGARMQEGGVALMQMASTSQAVARLQEAGLLTVSLITDPTYGGVAASFATNTDVLIAEAGARMGFAGPRVIRETIGAQLPSGFQTADFLLEHGQVDLVEERRNLRPRLTALLAVTSAADTPRAVPAATVLTEPSTVDGQDPWETVALARHRDRPTLREHVEQIVDGFVELHGDRLGGDCAAMVTGLGLLDGTPVAVIGQQKGHTTSELVAHNFGMPRPEGYRKALRVMQLAARLGLPIVTLVDTPGAFPGVEAEENGQAQAIARSVLEMSGLPVPVIAVVTGEGGSGGALALSVADRVLICENGIYSVISPEGCSSILWDDASSAPQAADALGITAPSLLRLGIVDGVVPEPDGGAHTDPREASERIRRAVGEVLPQLAGIPGEELVRQRRERFRTFSDTAALAGEQEDAHEAA